MTVKTAGSFVGQNVVAFPYAIGDRVRIADADCVGRVKQLSVSAAGREYQVAYYDEDKVRRIEWLSEDELERP